MANALMLQSEIELDNRATDIVLEELKKSIEFAHEKIREQKSEIDHLRMSYRNVVCQLNNASEEIEKLRKWSDEDHDRIIYMDDSSRRNSLRFRGIPEEPRETWEQCQAKVLRLLREHLNIAPEVERAHRLGKRMYPNRPREIIIKFLKYPDKDFILNNRSRFPDGITIREDFSADTMELRASFSSDIKQYREEGLIAYARYRTLVCHEPSRREDGRARTDHQNQPNGANNSNGGARGAANGARSRTNVPQSGAYVPRSTNYPPRNGINTPRFSTTGSRGGANPARGAAHGGRGFANHTRGVANGSRGAIYGARGAANRGLRSTNTSWGSVGATGERHNTDRPGTMWSTT